MRLVQSNDREIKKQKNIMKFSARKSEYLLFGKTSVLNIEFIFNIDVCA